MILLALAIAPGLAISLFFFLKDEYNREPRRHLITSFLLGMLSALMAFIIEFFLLPVQENLLGNHLMGIAVKAFLFVGFVEEWSKYVMVRYYAFRQPEFDEPFDGIVYSVMVSMGFATLENIFYVLQSGMATAFARMLLAVPAHAAFAVLMGYYLGRAKFHLRGRFALLMRGLLLAACFHGFYDFFLFLRDNRMVKEHVSDLFLFGGAVSSFVVALLLANKAVREHVTLSRQWHEKT